MNHMQSLRFESKLYASVKEKMEEMQQHNMSWIEVCDCYNCFFILYDFLPSGVTCPVSKSFYKMAIIGSGMLFLHIYVVMYIVRPFVRLRAVITATFLHPYEKSLK